jgi:hypothetical protein
MEEIHLEARDYLNYLQAGGRILTLARFREDECIARGRALILNDEDRVAVMLEDCGDPAFSGVRAGNLVNYILHPEGDPKIVGNPASVRG